jgi:hypothetical protein
MSWLYIALGVAIVVVLLNLALVFLLVYARPHGHTNAENQNH